LLQNDPSYLVREGVRGKYDFVDQFIANVKQTFRITSSQLLLFKTYVLDLSLPLEPITITTRQGTWINTAIFYHGNVEIIISIVNMLDSGDVVNMKKANNYLAKSNIKNDLVYINRYLFSCINNKIINARCFFNGLNRNCRKCSHHNQMVLTEETFFLKLENVSKKSMDLDYIKQIKKNS